MIIRVRTQLGTWRIQNVNSHDSFAHLAQRVETEHLTRLISDFESDASGTTRFDPSMTVGEAQLKNGDIIFVRVDESKTGAHEKALSSNKRITKTGDVVLQEYEQKSNSIGFRPGMLPLKSIKKHWTLNEFIALDDQFVYRFKAPDKAFCKLASIDKNAMAEFVQYMSNFNFQKIRCHYLNPAICCSV